MFVHSYESLNTIIDRSSDISLRENFVALAVSLDANGKALHCGLAIKSDEKFKLFHFDINDEVELVDIVDSKATYFLTKIPIIYENEVMAFLTKCELIHAKEPSLKFGFFFNGELFDENNDFVAKISNDRVTNCVFFCISVISGFLISQPYIDFRDWNPDNLAMGWYEKSFLRSYKNKYTEEQLKDLLKIIRRIPPEEYFSSASISELAITRKAITQYLEIVKHILQERHHVISNANHQV